MDIASAATAAAAANAATAATPPPTAFPPPIMAAAVAAPLLRSTTIGGAGAPVGVTAARGDVGIVRRAVSAPVLPGEEEAPLTAAAANADVYLPRGKGALVALGGAGMVVPSATASSLTSGHKRGTDYAHAAPSAAVAAVVAAATPVKKPGVPPRTAQASAPPPSSSSIITPSTGDIAATAAPVVVGRVMPPARGGGKSGGGGAAIAAPSAVKIKFAPSAASSGRGSSGINGEKGAPGGSSSSSLFRSSAACEAEDDGGVVLPIPVAVAHTVSLLDVLPPSPSPEHMMMKSAAAPVGGGLTSGEGGLTSDATSASTGLSDIESAANTDTPSPAPSSALLVEADDVSGAGGVSGDVIVNSSGVVPRPSAPIHQTSLDSLPSGSSSSSSRETIMGAVNRAALPATVASSGEGVAHSTDGGGGGGGGGDTHNEGDAALLNEDLAERQQQHQQQNGRKKRSGALPPALQQTQTHTQTPHPSHPAVCLLHPLLGPLAKPLLGESVCTGPGGGGGGGARGSLMDAAARARVFFEVRKRGRWLYFWLLTVRVTGMHWYAGGISCICYRGAINISFFCL